MIPTLLVEGEGLEAHLVVAWQKAAAGGDVTASVVGWGANGSSLCKLALGIAAAIAVDACITLLVVSHRVDVAILASRLELAVAADAVGWRAEAAALGSDHAADGRDGARRELVVVGQGAIDGNGEHEVGTAILDKAGEARSM